jgi:hypothetical protein
MSASRLHDTTPSSDALRLAIGAFALVAPVLHSITDVMEWYQSGFSNGQLWLNYVAFVPMSWLLLGIYSVHDPRPSTAGLVGAILYGAAFTYFAYTTLVALTERVPNYEALWARLGGIYTVHGALMIVGGLLFSWSALQARWLPKHSIFLFLIGLSINLLLSLLPAPAILQTIGSVVRNLGIAAMGYFILFGYLGSRPYKSLERTRGE